MADLTITNTFVANTVARASEVNQNFTDVKNYINARNQGTTAWDNITLASSGVFKLPDGSAAAPSLTFTSDTDTGVFRNAANDMRLVAGGTSILHVLTTGLTLNTGIILSPSGTATAPIYSFTSDANTGVYNPSADSLGFTTGGTVRASVSNSDITSSVQILNQAGTSALPGYSFSTDVNTGIYSVGADSLGISAGGTLRASVSNTDIISTVPILNQAGTSGAPAYSFSGDSNTGLYNISADSIGISTGATLRVSFSTTDLTSTVPVLNQAGTSANPAYSFSSDPDTGMYSVGANALGWATAGTLRATLDNTLFRLYGGVFFQFTDDGTAAAPILTWNSDQDTGFYRVAANTLGFTAGGAARLAISSTLVHVQSAVGFQVTDDGNAASPVIAWSTDTNTGLFRAAADTLALSTGGTTALQVDASATAGQTRMLVYDVDNATLERVTVGAADSGGVGFKVLRIPN